MECKNCGTHIHGRPARCPECDTRLKPKRPPLLIRGVFTLASVVVYLVLIVSLLATAVLTDISRLTSSGGIQDLLDHVLTSEQSPVVDPTIDPSAQVGKLNLLTTTDYGEYTVDEEGNIIDKDGNIIGNVNDSQNPDDSNLDFSLDMLTSAESLSAFLAEMAKDVLGEEAPITTEQIQAFIEESTVTEFIADKTSSLLEDILTGSENTTLTAEDVMALVEENQALIEEVFQVELTDEIKQEISASVTEAMGEEDLADQLRTEVAQTLDEPIEDLGGITVNQLLALIQQLTQPVVLMTACTMCLALMALLCGLSYYNIPKGLRWCATACLTVGLALSIPTAILQFSPAALAQQIPEMEQLLSLISGIAGVMAPVHYTIAFAGIALYALAILLRIFKRR